MRIADSIWIRGDCISSRNSYASGNIHFIFGHSIVGIAAMNLFCTGQNCLDVENEEIFNKTVFSKGDFLIIIK